MASAYGMMPELPTEYDARPCRVCAYCGRERPTSTYTEWTDETETAVVNVCDDCADDIYGTER